MGRCAWRTGPTTMTRAASVCLHMPVYNIRSVKLFIIVLSVYVCAYCLHQYRLVVPPQVYVKQRSSQVENSSAADHHVHLTTPQSHTSTVSWTKIIRNYLNSQREICLKDWRNKSDTFMNASMLLCECVPKTLRGHAKISFKMHSLTDISTQNKEVQIGGHWEPKHCHPRYRVAIVIPCRDRLTHLTTLLRYLHPMLQGQQANYTIIVVDQNIPAIFNKAVLMNVGFVYAVKVHNADCVIFHDVDFIPEDGRHLYRCQQKPVHLGAYHDSFRYKIMYGGIFGGATAFLPQTFISINGFSNLYFGWGGEDDEMSIRLRKSKIGFLRNPREVGGYKIIQHKRDKGNIQPNRTAMLVRLFHKHDSKHDGLNTLRYTFEKKKLFSLYTWLLVNILDPKKPNE